MLGFNHLVLPLYLLPSHSPPQGILFVVDLHLRAHNLFNLSRVICYMAETQTDILIYRVKDSGLEVFLFEHRPDSVLTMPNQPQIADQIALEPVTAADGQVRQAVAIEADWHDIPSLRELIRTDYVVAKQKAKHHIKSIIPELPEMPHLDFEQGTYVAIKDAFKQVLPEQYAFLKELKDIVREKNQTRYV